MQECLSILPSSCSGNCRNKVLLSKHQKQCQRSKDKSLTILEWQKKIDATCLVNFFAKTKVQMKDI